MHLQKKMEIIEDTGNDSYEIIVESQLYIKKKKKERKKVCIKNSFIMTKPLARNFRLMTQIKPFD